MKGFYFELLFHKIFKVSSSLLSERIFCFEKWKKYKIVWETNNKKIVQSLAVVSFEWGAAHENKLIAAHYITPDLLSEFK